MGISRSVLGDIQGFVFKRVNRACVDGGFCEGVLPPTVPMGTVRNRRSGWRVRRGYERGIVPVTPAVDQNSKRAETAMVRGSAVRSGRPSADPKVWFCNRTTLVFIRLKP